MPPRYTYWTILIDAKPTAFRAREKDELLPTFQQLKRTNKDVVLKWFAKGKLWDSPEQAQWAGKSLPKPGEKRGRDWRPGGQHKDPRDPFKKKPREHRADGELRASRRDNDRDRSKGGRPPSGAPRGDRPWSNRRPSGAPRGDRPWSNKPPSGAPRDRPSSSKPKEPGGQRPWQDRPRGHRPTPSAATPQSDPHKKKPEPPERT